MNNEIVKVLTQKEYITTFLDHNLRINRRDLTQRREFSYQFGILETFSTSASCLLGEGNKIIAVMKSHNDSEFENKEVTHDKHDSSNFINFQIENLCVNQTNTKFNYTESNLISFINKLVKNELEMEIPCPMRFSLHLTIINSDGNIYDCISHLIANLFSDHNQFSQALNRYIKLKQKVSTSTFCIIGDKLISDPTFDEVSISNFYFSIIKFGQEDPSFKLHKIKGDSADWTLLQEAFRLS